MALANPPVAAAVKQQATTPTRKVLAGGIAGAFATIFVVVMNTYVTPEKPIPADLALALTTVLSFIISYLVPPSVNDQITHA